MALLINEDCTACDACEPVCPNQAITAGNPIYVIDPEKCTECVGAEDEPQCKLVCPAECIVQNPNYVETKDELVTQIREVARLNGALRRDGAVSPS
ncbi:MAG: YfhL family 4Fe-4S dicluster ferredoxin [Rhodoplanes sp.]